MGMQSTLQICQRGGGLWVGALSSASAFDYKMYVTLHQCKSNYTAGVDSIGIEQSEGATSL